MPSDRTGFGIVSKLAGTVLVLAVVASVAVAGALGAAQPSASPGGPPAVETDATADGQGAVLDPGTAALSGFASTGEQGRLGGATVWVQVAQLDDGTITFVPDDPTDPTEFTVTLFDPFGGVIETATVDAEVLRVGSEGYDFADFQNVSSDESYTVWTTIDRNPNDATYAFPRLPSNPGSGVAGSTYAVWSVHERGNERLVGFARASTIPGGTATANLVLLDEDAARDLPD